MNDDDVNDVENKTVKPVHFVAAALGAMVSIPLTITTPSRVSVHVIYVGLPVILFWISQAFDLNPLRSLTRGRWLIVCALLACGARELSRGALGDTLDRVNFVKTASSLP